MEKGKKMNYLSESERTEKKFPKGLDIEPETFENLIDLVSDFVKLAEKLDSIKKNIIYLDKGADSEGIEVHQFDAEMLHCIVGIITEAGELAIQLDENLKIETPYDKINLCEEFGDLEWYLAIGYRLLGKTQVEIQQGNIEKLKKRFPEKFSNEKALNRNLDSELNVLNKNFGDTKNGN